MCSQGSWKPEILTCPPDKWFSKITCPQEILLVLEKTKKIWKTNKNTIVNFLSLIFGKTSNNEQWNKTTVWRPVWIRRSETFITCVFNNLAKVYGFVFFDFLIWNNVRWQIMIFSTCPSDKLFGISTCPQKILPVPDNGTSGFHEPCAIQIELKDRKSSGLKSVNYMDYGSSAVWIHKTCNM